MASQQVFEAADAFSIIKSATDLAVGVGVLAALTYSVLPLIATNRDKNRENLAAKEEEAEEVKWGVMTLLSCLPLFNWLVSQPGSGRHFLNDVKQHVWPHTSITSLPAKML